MKSYFVSFWSEAGPANTTVTLKDKKTIDYDDILRLKNQIEQSLNVNNVIILNFFPIKKSPADPEKKAGTANAVLVINMLIISEVDKNYKDALFNVVKAKAAKFNLPVTIDAYRLTVAGSLKKLRPLIAELINYGIHGFTVLADDPVYLNRWLDQFRISDGKLLFTGQL